MEIKLVFDQSIRLSAPQRGDSPLIVSSSINSHRVAINPCAHTTNFMSIYYGVSRMGTVFFSPE